MKREPWKRQAVVAGLLAAGAGSTLGGFGYLMGPHSHRVDWSTHILGLAGLTLMVAFGFCFSVAWVTLRTIERRTSRNTSAPRLIVAGAIGGALGGIIPAAVGMGGFGTLKLPYAGTASIVASVLFMSTIFVALWAPRLSELPREARPGLPRRFAMAALAASLTAATVGTLAWVGATTLALVPDLQDVRHVVEMIGYVPTMLAAGGVVSAAAGATIAAASWLYLTLELIGGQPNKRPNP